MTRNAHLPALATAVFATGALLAGCGGSDDGSARSDPAPSTQAAAGAASADGRLKLTAKDFSFSAETAQAKAGKLTIALRNAGSAPHELVLLKTSADPASLPVTGGRVSEKASVGEIAEIHGGSSGSHTFALAPGRYVFVCNVPGHYADGMHGTLTVR